MDQLRVCLVASLFLSCLGKMKKFQCYYIGSGGEIEESKKEVQATDPVAAARMYSHIAPDKHFPLISVKIRKKHQGDFDNPVYLERKRLERGAQSLESLKKLKSSIQNAEGDLSLLSYDEMSALIKNLKDYPGLRGAVADEESALREELFMKASFDNNLQTLLQTDLLRNVKSSCEDLLEVLSAHTKSSKGSNKSALLGAAAGLAALNDIRENTE